MDAIARPSRGLAGKPFDRIGRNHQVDSLICRLPLLFFMALPLASQSLRLDLGRSTRGWEPEVSLAWIELASGAGSKWALLDLSSGFGVKFPDGPGHGVGRLHTDARIGAEGVYAAAGLLLDFDDNRRPGAGLRLQLGHQVARSFHVALQWELLVSPSSAVLSPGTRGTFSVVAGVKF